MKTDVPIFLSLAVWSAACFAAPQFLDCRNRKIVISDAFHPASSSSSAIRLSCTGTSAKVVTDGIMGSSFE